MIDYNDLIGRPFCEQTFNCYDLAREVFKRNGIYIPKVNPAVCAGVEATNREMDRQELANWEKIDRPEAPCGVMFLSTNHEFSNHVGVYIGKGLIIHSTMKRAVAVDRLSTWEYKTIGYYKYVGNNYQD
ncbi:MAG: C40 family peptidase [Desulfobacterales bacterium]|nr:C40 family peptidase [Desulfobacterales bacterium]